MPTSSPHAGQKDQERGFALQKYLLLHSQHDALQKHLSQITPSIPQAIPGYDDGFRHSSLSASPLVSSDDEYLSSSPPIPTRHHQRSGSMPRQRPMIRSRRSSLPAIIDESIVSKIAEDELKLKGVNQQIKSTLTELLNCHSVREDNRYRRWVQQRLMDAEKELKGTRTRSCEKRRMSEDLNAMF